MIEGSVTSRGVPQVQLPFGRRLWPATIDTGFNGNLELPDALKNQVNARFVGVVESALAAGQRIVEDCYLVEVSFDGITRKVEATFVEGSEILIGTGMLADHVVTVDFPSRKVLIERFESSSNL